jgi:hypothetical protein
LKGVAARFCGRQVRLNPHPKQVGADGRAKIGHRENAMDTRLFKEQGKLEGSTSKWILECRQIYVPADWRLKVILLTFQILRKAFLPVGRRALQFLIGSLF